MDLYPIVYITYSSVSITLLAVLAVLFQAHRDAPGAKYMSLVMGSAALWVLCDFISDMAYGNAVKIFWDSMSYLGIAVLPAAWLIFVIQFTKNEKYVTLKNIVLLFAIPSLTFIMSLTNDLHHLMITEVSFVKIGQLTILETNYGGWFWVHAVYSYTLLLLGAFLLVKRLVGLSQILRKQSVIILIAISIPLAMNILYTLKLHPLYPIDLTVASFIIAGILCFIGMFRYKLFELIPAARNAVIEGMSGIMVVLDNKNNILDMNSAAKNIIGINKKNYIGKSVFAVFGEWSTYFNKYEHILQAEDKICIYLKGCRKYYDLKISPLCDSKNKVMGKFLILHDITALEEAIESLRESHKAAEAANRAKSQFLATMSHEIRTPLNGIIGMMELLASSKHTEEEMEYIQTVQTCSNSLLDIVNDILDFSKIEAGKMELEKVEIDLRALVDSTAKSFSLKAREKALGFTCRVDDAIPKELIGDTVRIRQILVNLIGNAFKFTDKGRIEVRADLLRCEDHQAIVEFSVSDTGIGIPEDKIDRLFASFQQVDSSTTRKFGGTGLGLAIVKSLVTMMNGRIEVESKQGEGSRFFFTLPLEISEKAAQNAVADDEIDFSDADINVLLVEDNKANQMLVTKLLEKKQIKVDMAGNGKEALCMLEGKTYDLIFMDIQMPEMDGFEATMAMRKKEAVTGNHTPIIALTANAAEDDKNACIRAGMDDYLTKPIRSENLYKCIRRHTVKKPESE